MRLSPLIAGNCFLFYLVTASLGQQAPPTAPPTPVLPRDVVQNGPPAQRPADDPGVPPAENLFFVPGEFVPQGGQIQWRAGYWTEAHPGWNWVPDRWIRRSSGWSFIEGNWEADAPPPNARTAQQPIEIQSPVETLPAREVGNVVETVLQGRPVTTVRTIDLYQPTTVITGFPVTTTWGVPFGGTQLGLWGTGFGGFGAVTPVLGAPGFTTLWGTGFGGIGAVTPLMGGIGYGPGIGFGPGIGLGWNRFGFARGGFGFSRFGFGFRRGWGWGW